MPHGGCSSRAFSLMWVMIWTVTMVFLRSLMMSIDVQKMSLAYAEVVFRNNCLKWSPACGQTLFQHKSLGRSMEEVYMPSPDTDKDEKASSALSEQCDLPSMGGPWHRPNLWGVGLWSSSFLSSIFSWMINDKHSMWYRNKCMMERFAQMYNAF